MLTDYVYCSIMYVVYETILMLKLQDKQENNLLP